jgi:hypothetical protein
MTHHPDDGGSNTSESLSASMRLYSVISYKAGISIKLFLLAGHLVM